MMAVGFFCEDIRAETAGTESIVGIMPDNIFVPGPKGRIPKINVYIRIHIDLTERPKLFNAIMKTPDGKSVKLGQIDESLITEAIASANLHGLPVAGIIMRATIAPFPLNELGIFRVVIECEGTEQMCAYLNIQATTSISSPPPVSQSPSDAPAT